MAMNQGVDAQVQNRVDAYRNNPQQLMQMYQQNQELVDLLALQKLKSEKEAAARDMQLKMQQQPGTIAQQREQEVLQLTKNELAQQTQGVLQRKQQQQQANLQRAAQGGIGALAQQRPAPAPQAPMPQMAGGGIVAFQPGGAVEGEDRITYQQWLAMSRAERERAGLPVSDIGGQLYFNRFGVGLGLNDPETGERIRREPSPGSRGRNRPRGGGIGDLVGDEAPRVAPAVAAARAAAEYDPASEDTAAPQYTPASYSPLRVASRISSGEDAVVPQSTPASEDALGGPMPTPTPAPAPAPAPATAAEAISTSESPATASETPRPPASDNTGLAGLAGGAGGMGGAEAALMRGVRIGEDVLGRGEKAARFAEMEAQLGALDEELYDPEAERRQQLQAFLIGTAGATNVGYAMAGGAAAAINLENRQKQNRRSRMVDRIALSERGMALDSELGRAALSLGTQMFADFNANQRAAMSAAATMDSARLRAVSEAARLDFDREKEANAETYRYAELEVREAENAVEQARNEEVAVGRRIQGILTATDNLLARSNQIYERGAEIYGVADARMQLDMLNPDDRGYAEAKAKFDTAVAEADGYATELLEERGVNDMLEELERQFYELSGLSEMPGINPDDILDATRRGE
jgi:hypothetical protein